MKDSKKRTNAFGVAVGSLVGFVLAILVCSAPLMAAPSVSGVQGTVANGQSITVTGSAFGAAGPNVVLFDDFELGTNGNAIKSGAGSAQEGQWSVVSGTPTPVYSNASSVSGSLAFRANMATYWRNYAEANLPSGTTQVFFSYWMYLPAGNQVPGGPSSPNWKIIWLGGPSHVQGSDLIVPIDMGGSYAVSCNVCPYSSKAPYLNNLTFTPGTWHRVWAWIIGSSSGGGKTLVWDMDTAGVHQELNTVNTSNLNSGSWWDVFDLNGFGNQSASYPMFDDVYIATGPNAAARVEIGNAAAYTSCSNLATVTPTSWSNGSIVATVRQGSFKSGQSVYVYVTDASGNVNAQGYPVTVGSGSSTTPPPSSPPPTTTNPPTVTITSPASGTTTTQGSIALKGTAGETNGSITAVSWTNSLGGNGIATYSSGSWSATVSLGQGQNVITVTATDNTGKTATGSVTVTYSTSTGGRHRYGQAEVPTSITTRQG